MLLRYRQVQKVCELLLEKGWQALIGAGRDSVMWGAETELRAP